MAPLSKTKFTILLYSFLFVSFFSCDKDVDLTANQLPESRETIVLDDTFEIPANQKSILDVLSNDTYLSDNIRIVEIGNPSNGTVVLNEDNTITYIPNSVYSYHNDSEETSNTEEGEEATTEATSTNQENTDNTNEQETTSSETSEEETNTENTASNQESNDNTNEQETTSSETEEQESAPETENAEQTQDTFTYTTETQNEDGTVSTETGTVTVDVAPDSEEEPSTPTETASETDYWRDPVINASRIFDEKYYDLDTEEIYAKEVNLQRGQVENYIEHENCPQRIKDKWANRIAISTADVNGTETGLQVIFDAHPEGTLFFLRAGVYQNQKNALLKKNQDIVGAYGAILDGSDIYGNSEEATRAIRSREGGYICNLKVREYPTWNDPNDSRAPRGAALETISNGAILNCEVHSQNRAIALIYGSQAMWNKITAGRLGMYAYGSHDINSSNRKGTIVKYNEVYDCNFNEYDGEHEAGGAKFVQVDGVIWSHNYIHDNPSGGGIWQDGDNRDAEIYNNVIIRTHRSVFSELSHTSNVHHNTIEYGSGFGAVYMSNSQGDSVHHNFIRWCRNGITIRDKERGDSKIYPGQPWRGINNEIYNNHIWQQSDPTTWTHGMATLFDGHIDPNNTTNKWHDNHYLIDDNASGNVLFAEAPPFREVFMYSKLAPDSDHKAISWSEWKNDAREENSTLGYAAFF